MKKLIGLMVILAAFTAGCGKSEYTNTLGLHKKSVEVEQYKNTSSTQKELLEHHNSNRSDYGLPPLVLDAELCAYAQNHAQNMSQKEKLYHSNISNLQTETSSVVGENVAWGQENEESVVNAWMWSPMHRWNILGTKYKKVGFGMSEDSDGKKYWCAVFTN